MVDQMAHTHKKAGELNRYSIQVFAIVTLEAILLVVATMSYTSKPFRTSGSYTH